MPVPDEIATFLDDLHFAIVATINADGSPQLTTLWYLRDGNDLILNTRVGRLKDVNLRRDPRLSLTVISADGYRYVTVKGVALLDEASGQETMRRLAIRYMGAERGEQDMRAVFATQERVTIRVPLDNVYAYGFGE